MVVLKALKVPTYHVREKEFYEISKQEMAHPRGKSIDIVN